MLEIINWWAVLNKLLDGFLAGLGILLSVTVFYALAIACSKIGKRKNKVKYEYDGKKFARTYTNQNPPGAQCFKCKKPASKGRLRMLAPIGEKGELVCIDCGIN